MATQWSSSFDAQIWTATGPIDLNTGTDPLQSISKGDLMESPEPENPACDVVSVLGHPYQVKVGDEITLIKHPVAGFWIPVTPSEKLFRHVKNPATLLVLHPDGSAVRYSSTGKEYSLKPNTPQNNPTIVSTYYSEISLHGQDEDPPQPNVVVESASTPKHQSTIPPDQAATQLKKKLLALSITDLSFDPTLFFTNFQQVTNYITKQHAVLAHKVLGNLDAGLETFMKAAKHLSQAYGGAAFVLEPVLDWPADQLHKSEKMDVQWYRNAFYMMGALYSMVADLWESPDSFTGTGLADITSMFDSFPQMIQHKKNLCRDGVWILPDGPSDGSASLDVLAAHLKRAAEWPSYVSKCQPWGTSDIATAPWAQIEEVLSSLGGAPWTEHLTENQVRWFLRVTVGDPRITLEQPAIYPLFADEQAGKLADELSFLKTLPVQAKEYLQSKSAQMLDELLEPTPSQSPGPWMHTASLTGAEFMVQPNQVLIDCGDGVSFIMHEDVPEPDHYMKIEGWSKDDVAISEVYPSAGFSFLQAKLAVKAGTQILPKGMKDVANLPSPKPGDSPYAVVAKALAEGMEIGPHHCTALKNFLALDGSVASPFTEGVLNTNALQVLGLHPVMLPHLSMQTAAFLAYISSPLGGLYWNCIPDVNETVGAERIALREQLILAIKEGLFYLPDVVVWKDMLTGTVWPLPEGAKILGHPQANPPFAAAWLLWSEEDGLQKGVQVNQGWVTSTPSDLGSWQVSDPHAQGYSVTLASNVTEITLEMSHSEGYDFGSFDWQVVLDAETEASAIAYLDELWVGSPAVVNQQLVAMCAKDYDDPPSQALGQIKPALSLLPTSVQKLVLYCVTLTPPDHAIPEIVAYRLKKGAYGDYLAAAVAQDLDAEEVKHSIATELVLTKTDKKLGGMHSKSVWVDQNGNEWMAKTFPSDPNAQARIDAEHWANKIGRLFGFRQPETRIFPKLDGVYSYVQFLAPASGDVGGVELTLEQRCQVLEEHVLDWLVSNHDSNYHNLLVAEGSGDIIGIDKGQAWRFFGKDKLAVGYLPPTNPEPVYYDALYSIFSYLDATERTTITERVLSKALFVSKSYDEQFAAMVTQALEKRVKVSGETTLIEQAIARKSTIFADFVAFYESIYAASGLDFDIDLDSLVQDKVGEDIYLTVSPELVARIHQTAVHGTALFFNTAHLDDTHILLYTETSKDHKTVLRGEARLLKDADLLITNWLEQQTIKDESKNIGGSFQPKKAEPAYSVLPGNSFLHTTLVAFVKTVNTHAQDGEYNQATVQLAKKAALQISASYNAVAASVANGVVTSDLVFNAKFCTFEQQVEWLKMTDAYLVAFSQINEAMLKNAKVSALFPEHLPYKQYQYTPSKEAIAEATGQTAEVVTESAPDSSVMLTSDTGKVLTVVKTNNSGTLGKFDPVEGELVHSSGEVLTDGYHGYKFVISTAKHEVEYRPWAAQGIHASQQGLLRIAVKDWGSGTVSEQCKAIEDVLDTLRTIGIDLSPADEDGLQLFYWKHLREVLLDRKDRKIAPWKDVLSAIDLGWHPGMSVQDQIGHLKSAWSLAFSGVAEADWQPKFMRARLHVDLRCGKPYWERPEGTLLDLRKVYKDTLPAHSLTGHGNLEKIVASGGLWATEERLRMLGTYITGMSSPADQGTGGATSIFFRQNMAPAYAGQIFLHPRAVLRTSNYAFGGDHFGKVVDRKTASFFNLPSACAHSEAGNELMIKTGVSIQDDVVLIVASDSQQRTLIVQQLKQQGVQKLGNLPVKDAVVTEATPELINKVWDSLLKPIAA